MPRLPRAASTVLLAAVSVACGKAAAIPAPTAAASRPTACELLEAPERYDRTFVSVRGWVETGFQDSFLIDVACGPAESRIWLEWVDDLPKEAWGEYAVALSGREWLEFLSGERSDYGWQPWKARPAVELTRDASFRELNDYLSRRTPQILFRRGRAHYRVEATITGRFDHLPGTILLRNASGQRGSQVGFGPSNRWMDRIVVRSVTEVRATRVAE